MPKKQTEETIYDAEFTESSAEERNSGASGTNENANKELVTAKSSTPADPEQSLSSEGNVALKNILITVAAIALFTLAALYVRGLQLTAV